LVRHQSNHIITPLVNDLLNTGLSGTTCVLTKTNEEALQITGLLLQNGMPARLIQTNEGFSLYNLLEIRFFLSQLHLADDVFIISDEVWAAGKSALANKYDNSNKLEVCHQMIKDFEATNPQKKYKSDLEVFIRESRLEDFCGNNGETIFVSTIHKAKGKEFDHVFLLLENFTPTTDEAKRLLYVAMTRAKRNLTIHFNSNFLNTLSAEHVERIEDNEIYPPPSQLVMHLTHKDLWLDYFNNKQHLVAQFSSGDALILNGDECLNQKGQSVLKFSRQFVNQIESMKQLNYSPKSAQVNFIVYWQKEGTDREVKIILPEVCFEKTPLME